MHERHPHDGPECSGCEWEHQPQAFRWFPELGVPLDPAGTDTGHGRAA